MSRNQTRRAISVSNTMYSRLRDYCQANGIPMSRVVENVVASYLGQTEGSSRSVRSPRSSDGEIAP